MVDAETISVVANVIVGFSAATALYLGWRQLQVSRETSALNAYEEFHLASLANSKLANGFADVRKIRKNELAHILHGFSTL